MAAYEEEHDLLQAYVDEPFCETVARTLGVRASTAKTAFINEPTHRVLSLVSWAMDRSEDPYERGRMIVAWARKRGCGGFRPAPQEYVSLAGTECQGEEGVYRENVALAQMLAQYWKENPKRLARVLDEVEMWLNLSEDES